MGEFFYGWRRKAGCVPLVVAFVLMMGWIRSFYVEDFIDLPAFMKYPTANGGPTALGTTRQRMALFALRIIRRTVPATDLEDDTLMVKETVAIAPIALIPYWSVVIPLTLLSAYLILWPGKRPERTPEKN